MSSFGYTVLGFGSHPSRGSPPLSLSLSVTSTDLDLSEQVASIPPDQTGVADTSTGDADSTASASGGEGSYSYAWTVTETGDDGANGASCAILSEGTKTNARYNSATFRVTRGPLIDGGGNPVLPPPSFSQATYRLRCTVTDGNGDTATADYTVNVINAG